MSPRNTNQLAAESQHADGLDEELARLFFAGGKQMRAVFEQCSREVDLSPPQAMALRGLGEAAPMRELADNLGCDASYITGIADSLEARGLIKRRADPEDRRVKQLVLTDKGAAVRQTLQARFLENSPFSSRLSEEERRTLRQLLDKLVQNASQTGGGTGC